MTVQGKPEPNKIKMQLRRSVFILVQFAAANPSISVPSHAPSHSFATLPSLGPLDPKGKAKSKAEPRARSSASASLPAPDVSRSGERYQDDNAHWERQGRRHVGHNTPTSYKLPRA